MPGASQRTLGPLRWSGPARLLAGLVVAALVVALLPPDAQGAETLRGQVDQPPQPPANDTVTAQAGGFSDVPAGHTFAEDIAWLAATGITQGRGDGTFGLNDPVTRGAMAAFLYRFSERPRVPVDTPGFTDVPPGHTFDSDIAWLAATGITQGRGDGTFGLNDEVTRGAMAAFLYRAAGAPPLPAGAPPRFTDVPAGHTFATEIAWLAATGITQGRDDGTFGLNDEVTRGQMAAFLSRFDEWLLPQAGAVFATPDDGEVELGWIAVPLDDVAYEVERAPGRWGPWESVTTTDPGADGVRLDDLDNGVAVFLRLRAVDDTGSRSLPTEAVGVTPVAVPSIDPDLTDGTLRVTRSDVLAADPAADGNSLVTLDDQVPIAGPGQLLVIEPSPPMPRGMLAEVVDLDDTHAGPGQRLLLTDAALEEVFEDPQIDWDVELTPQPVDDVGTALLSTAPQYTTDGTVTTVGLPTSALSCKDSGGIPLSPDAIWETGNPFPIELTLRNIRTTHVFDPGSRLFNRDPLLLLQVAGEVDTTLAMTAKLGVTCELSSRWRQTHPIFSATIGTVGGIPVTVTLEPAFSLTIAASGKIGFTETRYFAYTVEKDGDQPIDFRRAGSADPPELTATAGFSAEVFAGGDLSVMFGGGTGPANAAAGLFLEFGPALTASSTLTDPNCITLDLLFRASGGIRLELWVKRWNLELANANYTLTQLADYCAPDVDQPPAEVVDGTRVVGFSPVDAAGRPLPESTIEPSDTGPVDCGPGWPAVDAAAEDIVACGSRAQGANTCWVAADRVTLYCSGSPWSDVLWRYVATSPVPRTQPDANPTPMALELEDGRRCYRRTGGAWEGRLDGLAASHYCERPPAPGSDAWTFDDASFVLAGDGRPLLDESGPIWTVRMGGLSDTEPLPAPEAVGVRTVWFADRLDEASILAAAGCAAAPCIVEASRPYEHAHLGMLTLAFITSDTYWGRLVAIDAAGQVRWELDDLGFSTGSRLVTDVLDHVFIGHTAGGSGYWMLALVPDPSGFAVTEIGTQNYGGIWDSTGDGRLELHVSRDLPEFCHSCPPGAFEVYAWDGTAYSSTGLIDAGPWVE